MKKFLLIIALLIPILGLNAQSVDDETTIDYEGYSLTFMITCIEPAECCLSDCTNLTEPTAITIPSTVEFSGKEFSVTIIGRYGFNDCTNLTNIKIPNSVYWIAWGAFIDCISLTSIEIPNSVCIIESYAFLNCTSLTSVKIGNSVSSFGDKVFDGCSNLTSIVVDEGNLYCDSRDNCNAIIETSSNTLIEGCKGTIIPNTVTKIGSYAFRHRNLTTIELPDQITNIYENAFEGNEELRSIRCLAKEPPFFYTYGSDDDSFDDCREDMQVQVPEEAMEEYKSSRWDNFTITKIYPYHYGDYITEDYNDYSFKFTANPFYDGFVVTSETKPENATEIIIPSTIEFQGGEYPVTYIGDSTFYNCTSLSNIEIPESITHIGKYAFYDCTSLSNIEIPEFVTSIGSYAFAGCNNLKSISCYAKIVPLSPTNIFDDCPSDMTIYVPASSLYAYMSQLPWYLFNVKILGNSIKELSYSFDIYPNPVKDEIRISSEEVIKGITIFDIYGRQLYNQTIRQQGEVKIDVSNLISDVYFVKVRFNNGEIVKRVVIN